MAELLLMKVPHMHRVEYSNNRVQQSEAFPSGEASFWACYLALA